MEKKALPSGLKNPSFLILIAALAGTLCGLTKIPYILSFAKGVSQVFVNLLKLISVPIIFLSIVATISGMESFQEMKLLGRKVLKYTISTTLIAASIALGLFLLINPVGSIPVDGVTQVASAGTMGSYFEFLLSIVPANFIQALGTNKNITSVVFLALLLSLSILSLPKEPKEFLHTLFSSLFAALLQITRLIIYLIPLGVWGFVTLFFSDISTNTANIEPLFLYVSCVVFANLIQGMIILPAFLKIRGISPLKTIRAMYPALTIAFLSKSSNTALPLTIKCAQERAGVSKRIANFSLPLCATINMNGCAAFILITVLFVAQSHGITFSMLDMLAWIVIASVAALGNAGVPMGCYFLSSAFLATMGVPLQLMGIILPIYTIIDMIETSLNVWSDACVTTMVDKELR
jgi:Na+/H+-dicarboxylate symporter